MEEMGSDGRRLLSFHFSTHEELLCTTNFLYRRLNSFRDRPSRAMDEDNFVTGSVLKYANLHYHAAAKLNQSISWPSFLPV